MRTSSVEMALPYVRTGKANKYACCKSSSASASSKKNNTKNSKMYRETLNALRKMQN